MADWITLIAKRQTAYFASEVEVEVSSMESTESNGPLMNGLWSAPPVTIGNGQPTIAKLTFLLRPKENQKKPLQSAVFHYHFPGFTPSRNHPRQPPRSFRCRWNSNSLWVPGASLKRFSRPALKFWGKSCLGSMFNPRFRRYLPYPIDPNTVWEGTKKPPNYSKIIPQSHFLRRYDWIHR